MPSKTGFIFFLLKPVLVPYLVSLTAVWEHDDNRHSVLENHGAEVSDSVQQRRLCYDEGVRAPVTLRGQKRKIRPAFYTVLYEWVSMALIRQLLQPSWTDLSPLHVDWTVCRISCGWVWRNMLKHVHLRGRRWCTRHPQCRRSRRRICRFRNRFWSHSRGIVLWVSATLCCSHLRAPDVRIKTRNGLWSHVVVCKLCVTLTWDDRRSAVLLLVFFCNTFVEGPPVFEARESLQKNHRTTAEGKFTFS